MSKYPEFLNLDDPYIKICIICEGSEEYDYRALPAIVSQQVCNQVFDNYLSFFFLLT